ncbi:response regulator [Herbaspirillum lusitanum]|uniref:Response regulator n=1 Tax=Herbaspirillum lusitanum TaxID=213312 RepID=A0ABW9A6M6_9BURK
MGAPFRHTLLLVEDSQDVRELMSEIFQEYGLRVIAAVDGLDALAKIENNVPDVVLTDLRMPNMTGLELARHLRAHPVFFDIPIAVLSSIVPENLSTATEIDVFIRKPCSVDYLVKTINQMLLNVLNGIHAQRRQAARRALN